MLIVLSNNHTNTSQRFLNNELRIKFPIFLSNPAFDMGIPVCLAIFCFACVIPKARFHEKLSPGTGVDFLLMIHYSFLYTQMDSHLSWQVLLLAIFQEQFAEVLPGSWQSSPLIPYLQELQLQVSDDSFL